MYLSMIVIKGATRVDAEAAAAASEAIRQGRSMVLYLHPSLESNRAKPVSAGAVVGPGLELRDPTLHPSPELIVWFPPNPVSR